MKTTSVKVVRYSLAYLCVQKRLMGRPLKGKFSS